MTFTDRIDEIKRNIKYTWEHKKAFLKVEKELLGKNTLRGYLHDSDKLIMYVFLSKKDTSKIHTKYSRHHIENCKKREDYIQCMIDLECARFTKPDKPLRAYDFVNENYSGYNRLTMMLLIKEFTLIGGDNNETL